MIQRKRISEKNMTITRFDFVFSYWLFILVVLHILQFIKYNPSPLLILGILLNIYEIILMFYYQNKLLHIITFIILFIIMKIIPFLYIMHHKITSNDIIISLLIIAIYFLWLTVNNVDIVEFLKNYTIGIKENKPIGPFTYYVNKFYETYVRLRDAREPYAEVPTDPLKLFALFK
jgi:hypothetical protein